MKKRILEIELLITFFVVVLFLTCFYVFNFMKELYYYEYIILGILAIILIITLKLGMLKGMILNIVVLAAYGLIILFQMVNESINIWNLNYFIFAICPINTIIVGMMNERLEETLEILKKYETISETVINLDDITGYGNNREFLKDVEIEMAKAFRYKYHLSIGILEVKYFNELLSVFKKEEIVNIFKAMAISLNHNIRVEDMRYRIDRNLFAVILPYTDKKGALILKNRIKEQFSELTLDRDFSSKKFKIEFRMGIYQYDESIKTSIEYKNLAVKELEFDV